MVKLKYIVRKKKLTWISTIKASDTESFIDRNYIPYETNQNNG